MSEIFINTFEGGIDSDTAPNFRRNNTYSDSLNITLNTTGNYSIPTSLKGTEGAGTIADSLDFPSGSKVMKMIPVSGVIADFQTDVNDYLLIFVYTNTNILNIYLNKIHTSSVFLLFSETQTVTYTSQTTIDTVVYSESGIDTVYFTDGINELRQITINVPTGADTTNGYLLAEDLSVLRPAVLTELVATPQSAGSLLCGSYQFAIRLFNQESRKYTKWSLLTQPIQVSELTRGDYNIIRGGVGQYSSKKINLLLVPTTAEEAAYTHYQLAVVEHVGVTEATSAKLLEPTPLTGAGSYSFDFVSNLGTATIDISDIVVDKAAIKTCKTLTVKDNRLFLGNLTYYELEYDNGDPSASGIIETTQSGRIDFSSDDTYASRYVGYRRGEVYRFAISYFDKFYNFSPAKVLDLNGVTDNQISGSQPDLKFPSPSDDVKWGLFNKTTTKVQTLYPYLTIDNHPSWAKGFVILRAKRIKRIEFQTPLIPGSKIDGLPVYGNYPFTATEGDTPADVNYDNASPMNPLGTWVPKNFFFAGNRHAVLTNTNGLSWYDPFTTPTRVDNSIYYITPPIEQYDTGIPTSPISLKGNDFELFDVAFLKYDYTEYTGLSTANVGEYSSTNIHGTFYATDVDDYYYSGVSGTKSAPYTPTTFSIADFTSIQQNSPSNTLGTSFVSTYSNLVTDGIQIGDEQPTTQRLTAVKLTSGRVDVTYEAPTLTVPGGTINAAQLPVLVSTSDNSFVFNRTGGAENTDYVSAIEIVNVINRGVDDNRYGSEEYQHEFINTGAYYLFDDAELVDVEAMTSLPIDIRVYGGDTHVGLHQFKITDSSYGIQDAADTAADLITKWGRYFKRSTGASVYRLPAPYKGLSQVISVVMESDIRGSVVDSPTYDTATSITGTTTIPLATLGASDEGLVRSPFNYFYHPQYTIENDSKVFVPLDLTSTPITRYASRIAYSNERIFLSDSVGFDLFNALDSYDLSEAHGEINKLILNQDKLLSMQEDAIFYVPVNARVLESSDALSLSVRSAEVIDNPIIVSSTFGCQNVNSALATPNYIYIVDSKRTAIYRLSKDNQTEQISSAGLTSLLKTNGLDNNHISYNPIDGKVYIFSSNGVVYLYNDVTAQWNGRLSFNDNILFSTFIGESTRLFQNYASGVYALGVDSSGDLNSGVLDTNPATSSHFGTELPSPFITFTVNPNPFISKTFDNFIINSDSALDTISATGFTPSSLPTSTMSLALTDSGEGSQFVKVLRDASGKRIRGARSLITVNWKTARTSPVGLSAIITKYRQSQRP